MEVADFLSRYASLKTEVGRQRVVRHGHLPEREIMTGIGPVAVRQPRVRDREAAGGERIRFCPSILPPYARRTKSLEVLIPILYLKGISTGDFEEALGALRSGCRQVGQHAANRERPVIKFQRDNMIFWFARALSLRDCRPRKALRDHQKSLFKRGATSFGTVIVANPHEGARLCHYRH